MEKTEKKSKRIVKFIFSCIGLLLVFSMLFNVLSRLLVHPKDDRSYSMIRGFYEEQPESMDAVFIGSSNTYTDWNPIIAWNEYGINTYSMTSPAQPFAAQEYLCRDARKTQPNAIYVFNLVPICEYFDGDELYGYHALLDYMPLSMNKLKMTKTLCDNAGFDYKDSSEFFVPLIRYHTQWENWDGSNYVKEFDGYKGVPHYMRYFNSKENVKEYYYYTDETIALNNDLQKIQNNINSLIDYLNEENVKAMFIVTPTTGKDEVIYRSINTAINMVEDAGYTVINMQTPKMLKKLNIDLEKDFYNQNHLNIHGCLKVTRYLSDYLIKTYGIEDKRGNKDYKDIGNEWSEIYSKYENLMQPYALKQEYTMQLDYSFASPELEAESDSEFDNVSLSWTHEDSADKYLIYRKDLSNSKWEKIATVKGNTFSYVDKNRPVYDESVDETQKGPYYTVIACRENGKKTVWSNYNHSGTKITEV